MLVKQESYSESIKKKKADEIERRAAKDAQELDNKKMLKENKEEEKFKVIKNQLEKQSKNKVSTRWYELMKKKHDYWEKDWKSNSLAKTR